MNTVSFGKYFGVIRNCWNFCLKSAMRGAHDLLLYDFEVMWPSTVDHQSHWSINAFNWIHHCELINMRPVSLNPSLPHFSSLYSHWLFILVHINVLSFVQHPINVLLMPQSIPWPYTIRYHPPSTQQPVHQSIHQSIHWSTNSWPKWYEYRLHNFSICTTIRVLLLQYNFHLYLVPCTWYK